MIELCISKKSFIFQIKKIQNKWADSEKTGSFLPPTIIFFWKIKENLILKRLESQPESFNLKLRYSWLSVVPSDFSLLSVIPA